MRDFPRFAEFSDRELRELLRLVRRWDLPLGTVVVSEGGGGGSCFIIASGSVDVTVRVSSRQKLLAQLPAGSIFGQVSLISGEPRTATCSMRNDGVILELQREPFETLPAAQRPEVPRHLEPRPHQRPPQCRPAAPAALRLGSDPDIIT
jgi:CRP-like cAMP-binding protein